MSVEFYSSLPTTSRASLLEGNNQLEEMVLARHHVFAAYNKDGRDCADHALITRLRGELTVRQCDGIDAELDFYESFRHDFDLVPALDCGDHVDFVGVWEGNLLRFDVTTNLGCKKVEDYTKFENHIVAVWNGQSRSWDYFCAGDGKFVPVKAKRSNKMTTPNDGKSTH
jgi:hypothetical protein